VTVLVDFAVLHYRLVAEQDCVLAARIPLHFLPLISTLLFAAALSSTKSSCCHYMWQRGSLSSGTLRVLYQSSGLFDTQICGYFNVIDFDCVDQTEFFCGSFSIIAPVISIICFVNLSCPVSHKLTSVIVSAVHFVPRSKRCQSPV
jgi:hypothetical protein